MKTEVANYISNQMDQLKEMEKSSRICIDFECINLLLEEWMLKYNEFSMKELEEFFLNVHQIIGEEFKIRRISENKAIWLTK